MGICRSNKSRQVLFLPGAPGARILARILASAFACIAVVEAAWAVPDFRKAEVLSGVQVFPDDKNHRLYYFAPGDIEMATNSEGRPNFQLMSTRYTGSTVTGDQMAARNFNVVTFGVRLQQIPRENFEAIRTILKTRYRGRTVILRPLPINRLVNHVTYAPANDPSTKTALDDGVFEEEGGTGEAEVASSDGFWTRRSYSLKLSSEDAQILNAALDSGRVLISLSYAFMARGIGSDVPIVDISGSPELIELVPGQGETAAGSQGGDGLHVVRADTVGITLDARLWPELIRRIDLNDGLPPGYPALWVRCYDFQQEISNDLYMKRVQIEAMSVDDKVVLQEVTFTVGDPEHTAERVKFNEAIRLDRPYRYRVIEVYGDGSQTPDTEWTTQESWASTLDVTRDSNPAEPDLTMEEYL